MKILGFVALVTMLLAGCGNKGPLYMPEDAPKDKQTEQK